jgi:hypothetical protein
MPKTKVRKSRVRKSGMRKSLRTKRGGTRDKPQTESKKAEKVLYDPKRFQRGVRSRSYAGDTDEFPSDLDDDDNNQITHKKNTSVLSLPKQYFEGGPSYFKPTRKEVSEFLNTKKTTGNNVLYMHRKDRNLTLGEEPDTTSKN